MNLVLGFSSHPHLITHLNIHSNLIKRMLSVIVSPIRGWRQGLTFSNIAVNHQAYQTFQIKQAELILGSHTHQVLAKQITKLGQIRLWNLQRYLGRICYRNGQQTFSPEWRRRLWAYQFRRHPACLMPDVFTPRTLLKSEGRDLAQYNGGLLLYFPGNFRSAKTLAVFKKKEK